MSVFPECSWEIIIIVVKLFTIEIQELQIGITVTYLSSGLGGN